MAGDGFRSPVTLQGRYVELVPLAAGHARPLADALWDPEVSRFLRYPPGRTEAELDRAVEGLLQDQARGTALPFAIRLLASGQVIGATRYFHIDRPNRNVEIGGTFLDSRVWRTPVNTESKLLLLQRAFELERCHRVYLQTDQRNARSFRAIERLGARREAELREDALRPDGTFRTSVYFGILEDEWPAARARLEAALERPWSPPSEGYPPHAVPERAPSEPAPRAGGRPAPRPIEFRLSGPLVGPRVRLEVLTPGHLPGLTLAGSDPRIWEFLRLRRGDSPDGMRTLVHELLGLQASGEVLAYVVRVAPDFEAAGITRFLHIERSDRAVELGTWLHPAHWRTGVNSELKLLMLRHAFETEGVHRVALRTDSRNLRSQKAIEGLGAKPEGALRDHYLLADGVWRTSLCYSILETEWPAVRTRLESRRGRVDPVSTSPN